MGLGDMVKNGMDMAAAKAREAAQAAAASAQVAKNNDPAVTGASGPSSIINNLMGNYSQIGQDQLEANYGMYLMRGERFTHGFSLFRDKIIFTDRRILFIDHQGLTGKKTYVETIYLTSLISVEVETAGFGFDDAEITFTYFATPYYKAHETHFKSRKIEFPKNFNVQPLYCLLQEYAYANMLKLNSYA